MGLIFIDPLSYIRGFPGYASGKEPTCLCRKHKRCRFDPWVGKIPWRGSGNPLQYSCLKNTMDRRARQSIVHGVAKSDTTEAIYHACKQEVL